MDGEEFTETIGKAPTPDDRLAWFGALLARESRTYVEIVGGSAIEIYLSSEAYVSKDVDIVGDRRVLAEVLHRWGFREVDGRDHRIYWFRKDIGLVDLVGPASRSGLPAREVFTPYGTAWLSAIEPLIVRRLVRSSREDSPMLYRQAVELARLGALDWEYLEAEAKYEGIVPLLERLRKAVRK